MYKEDGKVFFNSKEEGEKYIQELDAERIRKAKQDYFQALYDHVEGDSKKFLSYILEHTPDEVVSSNSWFVNKTRELMEESHGK